MDNCIFCKIVEGQIPCYKVWENAHYLAFLDIHPIKQGHTVLIPKAHIDYTFDMEDQDLSEYMLAAKKVASVLKKTLNPKSGKVGMIIYGLDIDHAHIHLVPIDKSGDLSFSNSKTASKEELQLVLDQVKE